MANIFALATPRSQAALALIRISGKNALGISQKITQTTLITHQPKLCWLYEKIEGKKPQAFDQAVVTYFASPKSFTGENMVEFSTHGSLIVIKKLEQALSNAGARPAHPGEFSQRAFLNNKIDLTQAEAICDLIEAHNEIAASAAINSMKGVFSKKIKSFVGDLIEIRVEIEAEIDFIDEDIEFKSESEIQQKIKNIYSSICADLHSAKSFQKMAQGIKVALIGAPNVGKSSLMNALLKADRAIVSDEAGTTRDTLFENYQLDNLNIKLIDTAGIRKSDSKAEKLSIERSYEAINQADILLIVDDMTNLLSKKSNELMALNKNKAQQILWIHNKLDLYKANNQAKLDIKKLKSNPISQTYDCLSLFVSAKTGENLAQIEKKLKQMSSQNDMSENQYLARERHIYALERAKENLGLALLEMEKEQVLLDLLAEQLRFTHQALEEILGIYTSDELLGEIFANFCIGK